jgi:hypothetical protein
MRGLLPRIGITVLSSAIPRVGKCARIVSATDPAFGQWHLLGRGSGLGKHYFLRQKTNHGPVFRSLGPIPKSLRSVCAIARKCVSGWLTASGGFDVAASDSKIGLSAFEKSVDFFPIDLARRGFPRD